MKNKVKEKSLFGFCVAVGAAIFLSACNPVYYQPTPAVVPLLQEKGDLQVQASLADGPSYSVSGAYALSDRFGVMAHGYIVPDVDGYTGWLVEGGVGFGIPVSPSVHFETYGGFGFGSLTADLKNEEENIDTLLFNLSLSRLFLQPSLGYISKYFEGAATLRLSAVNYSDIERGPAAVITDPRYATLENLADEAAIFLEPGLTLRGGTEMVKAQLQYFHAVKLSGDALEQGEDEYYRNSVLSFGIVLKFATSTEGP